MLFNHDEDFQSRAVQQRLLHIYIVFPYARKEGNLP